MGSSVEIPSLRSYFLISAIDLLSRAQYTTAVSIFIFWKTTLWRCTLHILFVASVAFLPLLCSYSKRCRIFSLLFSILKTILTAYYWNKLCEIIRNWWVFTYIIYTCLRTLKRLNNCKIKKIFFSKNFYLNPINEINLFLAYYLYWQIFFSQLNLTYLVTKTLAEVWIYGNKRSRKTVKVGGLKRKWLVDQLSHRA